MCPNLHTEKVPWAKRSPEPLLRENPPPTLPERLSDKPVEWGTPLGSPPVLSSVILNDSWDAANVLVLAWVVGTRLFYDNSLSGIFM